MRPAAVLERRQAERRHRIALARAFVARLPDALGVRAAVVFGSVARGTSTRAATSTSSSSATASRATVARDYWGRLQALGDVPAGVEPVVWSPEEWRARRARCDPIAFEAERDGVWLVGGPDAAAGR